MAYVDLPIRVPSGERRVMVVKDCLGEGVPIYLLSLLFPKLFPKFRISSFPELFFVGVLHQSKICIVRILQTPGQNAIKVLDSMTIKGYLQSKSDKQLMEHLYSGKYSRIERIGNGTFGVIYKVKSLPEGHIYIAKHIALHNLDRQKAIMQYKILEKLRHCYIVKSLDSFEQDDELILIMQYCGEKDLSWHIEQRRRSGQHFSQYLVTNWILQMLLAVGFMHENKIVHRDLKPQNVFVDFDMNLKLGDFGISRLLDYTAQNCQTSAGTPSYMAPQMIQSQDYSYKADVWSLGCVIYQICSLEKLFPTKDENDKPIGLLKMMNMIKHKEIKDIPSIYSEDLRKLVRKLLNRNPSKRPFTRDLLKDKVLVQLMINTLNTKGSLKNQYSKGHQSPSLSSSLLDRQAEQVKEQLKKLSIEVGQKMTGLKQKKVQKNTLQSYQKQLKLKMKQVQQAVKKAFSQLYKNGKFQQSDKQTQGSSNKSKIKENSKSKISNNSLSNSSDMTIKSVQLNSNRPNQSVHPSKQVMNESDMQLVDSLEISALPQVSKKFSPQKSNSKINASEKIGSPQRLEEFQNTLQSDYASTYQAELNNTLQSVQSAYQQTMNNPQALVSTLKQFDALKNTLHKNPEAVLNDSFLNCTLQISGDKSMGRKLKPSPMDVSGSIQFNLTKRESPTLDKSQNPQNFQKKKQPYEQDEQAEYQMDFQEYNENINIHNRRQTELQAMLSLYQQQLNRQQNYNQMSTGFKQRQKYLVMSEIKEQSSEGSSVMSRNSSFQ